MGTSYNVYRYDGKRYHFICQVDADNVRNALQKAREVNAEAKGYEFTQLTARSLESEKRIGYRLDAWTPDSDK